MKKFGFTLAEVLITLTIIGVIAAMTLPTLMANTSEAQIGPKLAKAKASFEQANAIMLSNNSVDLITDITTDVTKYYTELSNNMKITKSGDGYTAADGMYYKIKITGLKDDQKSLPGYRQEIGEVTIDIDGDVNKSKSGATTYNKIAGVDLFYFALCNDGTLKPYGSSDDPLKSWKTYCKSGEVPTEYKYCAGSIFENNLKVMYK
ncbi:MAG: type II secretion system GspH family protein [bacterium]|nr:type II secretion system GspH family protein [bacterium]